jgi:hypothetical protein
MIAMRVVLVIAVTLAGMQIASRDQKKEPKKTIEIQSFSSGDTNSGNNMGSGTGGSSKATGIKNLPVNQNLGTSTARHK